MTLRELHWLAVIASLLLSPLAAQSATFTPGALQDGAVVVTLTGEIKAGDGAMLRGLVQMARSKGLRVATLVLNSSGGDGRESIDLAITVRDNAIETVVPANAICASGCFLLFAAGTRKSYAPSARIGVHSAGYYYREDAGAKAFTVDMARFMGEVLNVPDAIIGRTVKMRPHEMAWLTPAELALMSGSAPLQQPKPDPYIASVRPSVQTTPAYTVTPKFSSEARRLNAESISLIHANQADAAIPLLRRAYALAPFDAEIAGNYGYALYMTGSFTQARDVLALALKLRPKRGATWNNLGLTLVALGQVDWATECFVNYYIYSSRKDIAYRQILYWIETGDPNLRTAVLSAKQRLQLP